MTMLSGTVSFQASVGRARNAMLSRETLRMFLGADTTLNPNENGDFDFVVARNIGLITIQLPGTLSVLDEPGSKGVRLVASGHHPLAGSVQLDFLITFEGDSEHCALSYEGHADSTGLLTAVLIHGIDRVQDRLDRVFAELGCKLEKNQRSYEARMAAERAATARQV